MTKSRKRVLWLAIVLVAIAAVSVFIMVGDEDDADGPTTVQVKRMTIVDKALAVGTIDPETEISVKSKVSGVVKKLYVDAGDHVNGGEPILEVKPDPTPLELAEATRDVEMKNIALLTAERELKRARELLDRGLVSEKEYDDAQSAHQEAELRYHIAKEKLALIEEGKVRIANTQIESVIKAPISGFVLEKNIDIGDPVVPLTSFQEGTVLMTMANMSKLKFKGTVDEIDVGKLQEGMKAEIDIGAIPGDDAIPGTLSKISLKAVTEDNTTVFPVEVDLEKTNGTTLRAGYSANAKIIIEKKEDVLAIPERVVTFRNDSAFVKLPSDRPETDREVAIETGLSDAINIEVIAGLEEGQEVLEKPVKRIE